MTTQNERLRELVAKWRKEGDESRGVGRRIHHQFADELEAEILAEDKGTGQGLEGVAEEWLLKNFLRYAHCARNTCTACQGRVKSLAALLAAPPSTGEPKP